MIVDEGNIKAGNFQILMASTGNMYIIFLPTNLEIGLYKHPAVYEPYVLVSLAVWQLTYPRGPFLYISLVDGLVTNLTCIVSSNCVNYLHKIAALILPSPACY